MTTAREAHRSQAILYLDERVGIAKILAELHA